MDIEFVAKALKELGHPTRLMIYKEVVKAGRQGIAVGAIQEIVAIPASTLSHHIAALNSADLLTQRREGRMLYCVGQFDNLDAVVGFLRDECCIHEC